MSLKHIFTPHLHCTLDAGTGSDGEGTTVHSENLWIGSLCCSVLVWVRSEVCFFKLLWLFGLRAPSLHWGTCLCKMVSNATSATVFYNIHPPRSPRSGRANALQEGNKATAPGADQWVVRGGVYPLMIETDGRPNGVGDGETTLKPPFHTEGCESKWGPSESEKWRRKSVRNRETRADKMS